MEKSYLKQKIKETKYLHFVNEETKKTISIQDLMMQEQDQINRSDFEEENNIYNLKNIYETIDKYVSKQIQNFNQEPLLILITKNKKIEQENIKPIGIYTNNNKKNSLDCLIDGFEIETTLKKHNIDINQEDKQKLLETYIFEDNLMDALKKY